MFYDTQLTIFFIISTFSHLPPETRLRNRSSYCILTSCPLFLFLTSSFCDSTHTHTFPKTKLVDPLRTHSLSHKHTLSDTHTHKHAVLLSDIPGTRASAQCKLFSRACFRQPAPHKSRQSLVVLERWLWLKETKHLYHCNSKKKREREIERGGIQDKYGSAAVIWGGKRGVGIESFTASASRSWLGFRG